MRERLSGSVHGRAIIGVVALYALLLQAFFTAATPVAPSLAGIVCMHDGTGAPGSDTPVRHDHQCCTAAQAGSIAPPPTAFDSVCATPHAILVAWRPEASIRKTGPPTHAHSPRGPPLA